MTCAKVTPEAADKGVIGRVSSNAASSNSGSGKVRQLPDSLFEKLDLTKAVFLGEILVLGKLEKRKTLKP
jgi:hypothetical protein